VAVNTDTFPARYRRPQLIGRGGMGEIYRATDSALGRDVAIKILAEQYAEDESVRERFTREALAAARLSGEPNTVTIYDVGQHHGRPYMVMSYLGGGSLEEVLARGGAQPPERVFDWIEQAGRSLDAAHERGVVHRDVKPGNLMLDADGNVAVADFGIASAAGMQPLTMTGTVLGTAGYLSPEQAQGDRATPASDRYALAVVGFELLTGQRPFEADTPTAEAYAHANAPVPSVSEQRRGLPAELDGIFRKALAKDPSRRYPSCAAFVAALRAAAHTRRRPLLAEASTTVTTPLQPPPPPRSSPRPRTAWPALVGLLLLGALAGALLAYFLTRDADNANRAVPQPSVVTHTVKGRNQTVTVVSTALPPPSTAAERPPSDGHTLNDQGYEKMRAGDYAGALPLLQQAVENLSGAGPSDPYEGYANFNLGYTLLQLDQCEEATQYLERAKQLEPQRHEPKDALGRAKKCAKEH
jgi:eukaryotic-like serine/threonine-protein kinase